ncbi:MAG TPA: Uma2 family endonuclease [Vicinamibacterales bacterium]|nr:Uma2 family endonuclease [Vicinamibacterales bacterium]
MAHPRRAARPATYDDLLKVPDHLVAELVGGELFTTPRPGPRHARASSGMGAILTGPFDHGRGGPGGWHLLDEPELHLGPDILVPDIAGWRRERLPSLPEEAFFSIAPDWICEVVSPSTVALDRVKKLAIYARESVRHAWIVDPLAQTLEVMRLEHGHWVIVGTWAAAAAVQAEPFAALDWDLTLLWDQPPPAAPR